jgi:hypothetical protein
VIESEAHVADSNPFPGAEGEVAHREAFAKSIDDIYAGRPVDVSGIITPDFLERSRSLVERLQTEQPMALPVINRRAIELAAEQDRLTRRDAELSSSLESLPEGDASAADRLNRLQAVDQQISEATDLAAKRKLNERRDQILVDTNPEALQAAAAPIEQRRAAEAERASIADRLDQITEEHANLQASTLPEMQLPALGQSERIPGGPKQMELPFETAPEPKPATEPGPQPFTQTPDQMRETLAAPDHQDAIRADIDRARAMGDVQVPGVDEQGNHTMISADKAMDEVDAYKAAAEQIQACANPAAEEENMQPMKRVVTERGRSGRPIASAKIPAIEPDDIMKVQGEKALASIERATSSPELSTRVEGSGEDAMAAIERATSGPSLQSRVMDSVKEKGGVGVRISDVASDLPDVPLKDIHAEMQNLQSSDRAVLSNWDDPRSLTPAMKAAAINIGGDPRHAISLTGK